MHLHFGSAVSRLNRLALRQGADCLCLPQFTAIRIVGESRCGAIEFVDNVGVTSVRMKSEMTRAGPRLHRRMRRIVWLERRLGWVELVNEQLIQAQVGGDSKSVVRVDIDRVCV